MSYKIFYKMGLGARCSNNTDSAAMSPQKNVRAKNKSGIWPLVLWSTICLCLPYILPLSIS